MNSGRGFRRHILHGRGSLTRGNRSTSENVDFRKDTARAPGKKKTAQFDPLENLLYPRTWLTHAGWLVSLPSMLRIRASHEWKPAFHLLGFPCTPATTKQTWRGRLGHDPSPNVFTTSSFRHLESHNPGIKVPERVHRVLRQYIAALHCALHQEQRVIRA